MASDIETISLPTAASQTITAGDFVGLDTSGRVAKITSAADTTFIGLAGASITTDSNGLPTSFNGNVVSGMPAYTRIAVVRKKHRAIVTGYCGTSGDTNSVTITPGLFVVIGGPAAAPAAYAVVLAAGSVTTGLQIGRVLEGAATYCATVASTATLVVDLNVD